MLRRLGSLFGRSARLHLPTLLVLRSILMSGGRRRHLVLEVANTMSLSLTTSLVSLGLRFSELRMRLLVLTRRSRPGRRLSMARTSNVLGRIAAVSVPAVISPTFFEMKVLSGDLLLTTRRSITA